MDLTASRIWPNWDLELEDVGAPLTSVEDGLKLLGGSQAGLHADLGAIVHLGAERLGHHDPVYVGRRCRTQTRRSFTTPGGAPMPSPVVSHTAQPNTSDERTTGGSTGHHQLPRPGGMTRLDPVG